MAADDLYNVIPVPELSPQDLGVSLPTPMAPQAPVQSGPSPAGRALSLLASGFAAALGPHRGGGIPQGMVLAQRNMQAQEQQKQQQEQVQYQREQQLFAQQQAQFQAETDKKQAIYKNAVDSLRKSVSGMSDSAQYDQTVNGFANLLQSGGIRATANQLRVAAPFVQPSAQSRASKVLDSLLKDPLTEAALKQDPQKALSGTIAFDANGDGTPEKFTIGQLAAIAGRPMLQDPITGSPIVPDSPKEKLPSDIVSQKIQSLNDLFLATNHRQPTAKEHDDILNQAKEWSKEKPPSDASNSSIDMDAVASASDAIRAHRMAPSQLSLVGGMGATGVKFKQAVIADVLKNEPKFDFTEAESNFQFGKNTGTQNTVRYIDTVQESMPLVLASAQKLQNGRVRSINALINAGKNQLNDVDLKKFQTDVLFVADEIAKILQGGGTGSGTSDAKLRQAGEILNTSDTPASIAAALGEAQTILGYRRGNITKGTYMEDKSPAPAASTAPTPNATPRDYGDYLRSKGKQ